MIEADAPAPVRAARDRLERVRKGIPIPEAAVDMYGHLIEAYKGWPEGSWPNLCGKILQQCIDESGVLTPRFLFPAKPYESIPPEELHCNI